VSRFKVKIVHDVLGDPLAENTLSKLDGRVLCEHCIVAEAEAEIRRSKAT
jgi:hypothetical protein